MRTWPPSDRPPLGQAESQPRTRCPRDILGESQARLKPEQAAKINMPVLLLTGEESTDPAKAQVGAVAAALADVQRLVLAGQQHIADILDPETFAKHLLGFLHGSTLHRELVRRR
jgi:pimeloyl-ACP methyl ester carboxylesterase